MRRVIFYGLLGGVLLVLLRVIEYQYFVRAYPGEVYGGLVAAIFAALGIYFGRQGSRHREVTVIKEVRVPVPAGGPFVADVGKLKELGITPREHEILGLIAEGLSNREIGERLFVSENTVKATPPGCSTSWASTAGSRPCSRGPGRGRRWACRRGLETAGTSGMPGTAESGLVPAVSLDSASRTTRASQYPCTPGSAGRE